jgi:hypothetical protein
VLAPIRRTLAQEIEKEAVHGGDTAHTMAGHGVISRRDEGAMKVLVTAATKHGATAEIAAAIGEVLGGEPGLDAAVIPPEQVATIDGDDAVVLGSAVYAGHWLAAAKELVDRAGDALAGKPVWLFSSGPSWLRCGSRKGTSGTGPRSRAGRPRSPTPCGPTPDRLARTVMHASSCRFALLGSRLPWWVGPVNDRPGR